jgi:putative hemolysin
VDWALRALDVRVECDPRDAARVPLRGALLVVANHPFGGVEGLALAAALLAVRPDVRLLANDLLSRLEGLDELIVGVDVFGGPRAGPANRRGLRHALEWLRGGGALLAFPAGEVAHLDARSLRVRESPWHPSLARLALRARAAVVPAHVPGRAGAAFHLAGLLHERLRTALLPRELLRARGRTLRLRSGTPVAPERLAALGDRDAAIAHLRWRSDLLAARDELPARGATAGWRPIADPVEPAVLAREIEALPPECLLVDGDDLRVLVVEGRSAPNVLRELGRLREVAFRAAGEGTGHEVDLDRFDATYRHLFAWSRSRREILGAYRVGRADDLVRAGGRDALYTCTLFDIEESLLRELGPALELGRSFVRLERQRSPTGLALLWKGLGALACREPERPVLLGAVSVSASYGPTARGLIQSFLQRLHGAADAACRVRPRHGAPPVPDWERDVAALGDLDELSSLVEQADHGGRGVPVLVRRYVGLGARVLGFNVDPAFSNVLDALIVVDLRAAPSRLLARFMGREEALRYLARAGPGRAEEKAS